MPHDWIIDFLADLQAYAERNGMQATAAQLEDASLVALAELSSLEPPAPAPEPEEPPADAGDSKKGAVVTRLFARRGLG